MRLQQPPRLVIFDLDGTLIDSRADLVHCVNATLLHLQRPALPESRIAGYIGDGAAALVRRSLDATGSACNDATADEALHFFLAHYREHLLDHTHVYPGVLATLAQLRSAAPALAMAVLTNKPVMPSRRLCDALGLSPFLFANYGGNSFATKKPHPAGLLALWREAEGLLGEPLHRNSIVLIGDSEVDVRTARNAGVHSLGCTWGFATEKLLAEAPEMLAANPADWLDLLGFATPAPALTPSHSPALASAPAAATQPLTT